MRAIKARQNDRALSRGLKNVPRASRRPLSPIERARSYRVFSSILVAATVRLCRGLRVRPPFRCQRCRCGL
jgi:hypothetical protein